jgi:hypothetical protein
VVVTLMELRTAAPDLAGSAEPGRGLNLLEPPLSQPRAAVFIPLHDHVILVSLLNRAEFPSWLSEVAQAFHPVSGIQSLIGRSRLGKRWLPGTV